MGLFDLLSINGSVLSTYDGATPPVNPLATRQSIMHADPSGKAGYSLDGADFPTVNKYYVQYDNNDPRKGPNLLPRPSLLDLNGITPPKYLDLPHK
jgi:hypothetical protein